MSDLDAMAMAMALNPFDKTRLGRFSDFCLDNDVEFLREFQTEWAIVKYWKASWSHHMIIKVKFVDGRPQQSIGPFARNGRPHKNDEIEG